MSLNYDKLKDKLDSGGGFWTSYSDLATVLSVLFLLLYVVATLQSTSHKVAQHQQVADAEQQIEELKNQVRSYDVLKESYLKKGASPHEKKMYEELIGQMKLLEEKAQQEKEAGLKIVRENEEKEKGLNKYQAIIKNIISANMLAQS